MIDLSQLQWLAGEGVWRQSSNPEIIIGGHEDGPLPGRLVLAEAILSDIDKIVKLGKANLKNFVDYARFASKSDWQLETVEVGRNGDAPVTDFVAYFSLDEDIYGLWSVTFHVDDRLVPWGIGFARQQH